MLLKNRTKSSHLREDTQHPLAHCRLYIEAPPFRRRCLCHGGVRAHTQAGQALGQAPCLASARVSSGAESSPFVGYGLAPTSLHVSTPQVQGVYEERDILQAKEDLLSRTNMVDFAGDIHNSLQGKSGEAGLPKHLQGRREEVLRELQELQTKSQKAVDSLSNSQLVAQLKGDKQANLTFLREQCGMEEEDIEALYNHAKFQFECGNYAAAAEFLYHYRSLCTRPERSFSALWGKLAADILMQDWESAMDDIKRLKDTIESKQQSTPQQQLQQRVWLMHWSLFVYFNHELGRDALIDLFMQDRYMNAIQAAAKHLLRYVAVAAVTNRRRHSMLRDLVRVLDQEKEHFADPITSFLRALFLECDFEEAEQQLKECDAALSSDFFVVGCKDDFMDNARLFILETYCRIHRTITTSALADRLGLDPEAAEHWVVSLIRSNRLDARIDSTNGTIVMNAHYLSPYEHACEKARPVAERTRHLVLALNHNTSLQL